MKTLTYDPGVGFHIDHACNEAVEMAKREGANVSFSFNGIELVCGPETNAGELSAKYDADSAQRYEAYQNSPEGKAQARERAEEIERKQESHDALVRGIKTAIGSGQDAIMAWLRTFQDVSDDVGVKKDFASVIAAFEAAGYFANENTGLPRDHYQSRPIMGRYIIGKAISCMKNGMPPHQITHTFVEKYFALPAP